MKNAIKIINQMLSAGIIQNYAVGGGVAALFYIEPVLTYDLDIFFCTSEERLDILSSLYDYLAKEGYHTDKEYILVEGVAVQFLPAYNKLIEESIENSQNIFYEDEPVKVLSPEYLIAICLQTNRSKDIARIEKFFSETSIDTEKLNMILKKHNLEDKFKKYRENKNV